jgi:hypothetical protein
MIPFAVFGFTMLIGIVGVLVAIAFGVIGIFNRKAIVEESWVLFVSIVIFSISFFGRLKLLKLQTK